jgi:hypothetical protein
VPSRRAGFGRRGINGTELHGKGARLGAERTKERILGPIGMMLPMHLPGSFRRLPGQDRFPPSPSPTPAKDQVPTHPIRLKINEKQSVLRSIYSSPIATLWDTGTGQNLGRTHSHSHSQRSPSSVPTTFPSGPSEVVHRSCPSPPPRYRYRHRHWHWHGGGLVRVLAQRCELPG